MAVESALTAKAILALDLGVNTGWAIRMDAQIISGVNKLKPGRFEGGGMRYLKFKRWLDEMLDSNHNGSLQIYFEEVRHHSAVDAAHVYGGLLATLSAWCEEHRIPYLGVPVGTIKKHATGKGNASKEAVIEAMRNKGHAPQDDNEADALALLYCVLAGGF